MPLSAHVPLAPAALTAYGLTGLRGDLLDADPGRGLAAAREAALRINDRRRTGGGAWVSAGQVRALCVLALALGELLLRYAERVDPSFWSRVDSLLGRALGADGVARLDAFLSALAHVGDAGGTNIAAPRRRAPRDRALPLLLLGLLRNNRALAPVHELVAVPAPGDDDVLASAWGALAPLLESQPGFAPEEGSLAELLTRPQRLAPDDLAAQLRVAHEAWHRWAPETAPALLLGAGELSEEQRPRHQGPGPAAELAFGEAGAGSTPGRGDDDPDAERYAVDRDWMPQLVLLAKNTHVWLHQLSVRYRRSVTTLDAVPDEALDEMAARGITGLWLIGVWQRSRASREIKRQRGNPEALASAYAVDDYRVADDLGGETALDDLRRRAGERGIRLAGDMVPNHTGLDGRWVHEHPDWFVSEPHPPFPSYTFDGPDLSDDPHVAIRLEDGYADHSDAAVVFQRADLRSGDVRYIYHGNDGTHTPWNDTAQLDYLNPELRQAVIAEITAVARRFPVIRFDAAMVLARRHVRRLWHPEPGAGSDIPGRAAHALSRADFDRAMPREFWREVVEHVAAEAPDTLLLAEAFWLMEGYFVRTLGMHRVYNSAFMHMVRDGDNGKYRRSLENVLAYDPQILQRFVNFLSNPDEATAESQFGKGDRYFGACALLATLPGLPLIAHGQLEGYQEKYGMEFARDYRGETPDEGFLAHHERMIYPLLRDRALFAGAERFRLFAVRGEGGGDVADVYCFANGRGDRRALVLFNNSDAPRAGRAHLSVPWRDKTQGRLLTCTLAEALGLAADDGTWVMSDARTGATQETPAAELRDRGLWISLAPYECRVYLDLAWRA
jgi:glycosidase